MQKTMAWDRLNDAQYSGSLRMSEFYDLMLKAGYSESAAQRAANQRGWERLQAGVEM